MIYDLIAPLYDTVNRDVDYVSWADWVENTIRREYRPATPPSLVLDLGCGTGNMTLELAKRGYDMTGVDASPEMLDIARNKAEEAGVADKILYLCQDMTSFDLYGTVDVTVSCLDCINHLTATKDLDSCFSLVHLFSVPDGLFFFDINGKHKFETAYANETYTVETEKTFCIWQNEYKEKSHLCDFWITVFEEGEDGTYERYDDVQRERMYPIKVIAKHLEHAGFEVIGAYSDFENTPATDAADRIYFVARCKK